jgi:transcriptional regulator
MYVPAHFRIDDPAVVASFIQEFDFAAIVTNAPTGLIASHVPVVVSGEGQSLRITGHLARANGHWKAMDGQAESMVIFSGPHAYISPSWYVSTGPVVPTWNYAVVHAYGRPVFRDDAAFLQEVVETLTRRYEGRRAQPWSTERLPAEAFEKMLGAIVGFEMPVERYDAKFKLGQNRSTEDRAGAAAGLDAEQSPGASAVADFMRRFSGAGR